MANDFYQHSGHPGTRAPRSSALLRAEFAAIEDGFDKLPDVGTANLFSVSDGSALVGKTAAQAKVILALENVTNTADADKPISTLTQSALDLKIPFSYITSSLYASAGRVLMPLAIPSYDLLLQWGAVNTHATPGTGANHSFAVAYDVVMCVVACSFASSISAIVNYGGMSNTGFQSYSNASAVAVRYFAIGAVTK